MGGLLQHLPVSSIVEDGHPAQRFTAMEPKHGGPATLVTSSRHGQGLRWLARWVDHDGNERSKAFARKAMAQAHVAEVTTALTTGTYADQKRGGQLPGPASPNPGRNA